METEHKALALEFRPAQSRRAEGAPGNQPRAAPWGRGGSPGENKEAETVSRPERAEEEGYPMGQSLAKNLIHLIFSTKHREPWLTPDLRLGLHAYLGGILRDLDSPALAVNSVWDHVHVLLNLHKTQALAKVVMEVKRGSSIWIKTRPGLVRGFQWQNGYGAFSVSQSAVEDARRYIGDQEEHHRVKTFQEELREFLRRYEIEYDERYVWD